MARSRSRAPSPAPRRATPPPPAPRAAAPPPAQQQAGGGGGIMSGLGGMVVQGMALGTGSAMAHRAVDAVMGSRHPAPAEAQQAAQTIVADNMPCHQQAKAFSDCMGMSNGEMEPCRIFFERMQECRMALQ